MKKSKSKSSSDRNHDPVPKETPDSTSEKSQSDTSDNSNSKLPVLEGEETWSSRVIDEYMEANPGLDWDKDQDQSEK